MNRHRNLILIVTLLFFMAAFFIPLARAQDSTPAPTDANVAPTAEATAEPAPVVDTTTTTTTTTTGTPVQDIGLTLTWALAFLTLWQAAGIAYAVTVEKTIKPVIYSLVAQFTDLIPVRNGALILAVFAGAFTAVNSGHINLFADAPFGLFTDASPGFLLVLNSLFVAAGAFMGHEIWQTLESWLKKAKAVTDVIAARPGVYSAQSTG